MSREHIGKKARVDGCEVQILDHYSARNTYLVMGEGGTWVERADRVVFDDRPSPGFIPLPINTRVQVDMGEIGGTGRIAGWDFETRRYTVIGDGRTITTYYYPTPDQVTPLEDVPAPAEDREWFTPPPRLSARPAAVLRVVDILIAAQVDHAVIRQCAAMLRLGVLGTDEDALVAVDVLLEAQVNHEVIGQVIAALGRDQGAAPVIDEGYMKYLYEIADLPAYQVDRVVAQVQQSIDRAFRVKGRRG